MLYRWLNGLYKRNTKTQRKTQIYTADKPIQTKTTNSVILNNNNDTTITTTTVPITTSVYESKSLSNESCNKKLHWQRIIMKPANQPTDLAEDTSVHIPLRRQSRWSLPSCTCRVSLAMGTPLSPLKEELSSLDSERDYAAVTYRIPN